MGVFIIGKFGLALARFKAHSPVYLAGLLLLFSGMSSLFLGKLLISWVIYFLFLIMRNLFFTPPLTPNFFLFCYLVCYFSTHLKSFLVELSQFQLSYTLYDRSNTAVFMY